LLSAFWSGHDATYPSYSTQYRSAVFYTSEQQRQLATDYKKAEEARLGETLYTDIEPLNGFYVAEDYHQKYYLRQNSVIANALYNIYPDAGDFRDSTAAARLNGYLAGYGDRDSLNANMDNFGLPDSAKQVLLNSVQAHLTPGCPAVTSY
jgi:peptide-methionine (S)-S-oxide reductase